MILSKIAAIAQCTSEYWLKGNKVLMGEAVLNKFLNFLILFCGVDVRDLLGVSR